MLVYKFSLDYFYILNIIDLPKRWPAGIDGWTILARDDARLVPIMARHGWLGKTAGAHGSLSMIQLAQSLRARAFLLHIPHAHLLHEQYLIVLVLRPAHVE